MKKTIAKFFELSEIKNYKINGNRNYAQATIDLGECVNINKLENFIKDETGYNVNIDVTGIYSAYYEGYKLLIEIYY